MKTSHAGTPSHEPAAALRAKAPWRHVSIAALLATLAVTSVPLGAQGLGADDRSKALNQLFLDFSIASRSLFPIAASANGWRRYDDQFAVDISEEHRQKQREWCGGSLKALAEFDRSKLSEHEYLPKSRTAVGLSAVPGGAKLYEWHIRTQTTLALTSKEIMDVGRRELERARKEIEALRQTSGSTGDVREWARKLRAETPRYASHADAIQVYKAMHERVYERVQQVFGRLPRTPYEIRAVESYREASAPSQYWRAGGGRPAIFYANLRAINREPSPVYVGLFLHETLPGHHLQIALAQENTALPSFRRVGNYAGFSEGWARYAEWLGLEMGLYDDPYQRLVWFHNDLFAAVRLVIDVGLHAQGWTREQAIKFLEDNTFSRELFADYEQGLISVVERAISLPAYATAYKIGELRFRDLRRRAEAELGPRFDVRAFHDELLKDGAMPLDILRAKMERWIANQKAKGTANAG